MLSKLMNFKAAPKPKAQDGAGVGALRSLDTLSAKTLASPQSSKGALQPPLATINSGELPQLPSPATAAAAAASAASAAGSASPPGPSLPKAPVSAWPARPTAEDARAAEAAAAAVAAARAAASASAAARAAAELAELGALPDAVVKAAVDAYLYELVRRVEAGAAADGDAELPQTLSLGDFELLRLLGKGGYGKVFQVRCCCAMKAVTPDLTPRISRYYRCAATSTRRSTR